MVTLFTKEPFEGAHEIQSFCLGHTEFVSCVAFTCSLDCPDGFFVSGSGDSTVRLWDTSSGSLLDTCEVGTKDLCKSYPTEFVSYFHYCRAMCFEDKPDYPYLKRLFRDLFIREGYQFDYVFDWTVLKYQLGSEGD